MKKASWYFFAIIASWWLSFSPLQAQEQFGEDTEKPVINNVIIIFSYNGAEVIQTINQPTQTSTQNHTYGEGGFVDVKETRILVGEQPPINELASEETSTNPNTIPIRAEEELVDYTNHIPNYPSHFSSQTVGKSFFQQVNTYPNPTVGVLNLESDVIGNAAVSMYNLVGQKVLYQKFDSLTKQKLALNELPSGIYLLEIIGNGWKQVQKIQVNDN